MYTSITIHGKNAVLFGDLATGGPICGPEVWQPGEISYAVLNESGEIWRNGENIGSVEDITVHDFFSEEDEDQSWEECAN